MRTSILRVAIVVAGAAFAPLVLAQATGDKPKDGAAGAASGSAAAPETSTTFEGGKAPTAGTTAAPAASTAAPEPTTAPVGKPADEKANPNDAAEEAGKTYYFIGARYRHHVLPKFMLDLFVAGGPKGGVSIPGFGIEAGIRKDGFDTIFAVTYNDYGMAQFPFKGKDEADTAFELVTSKLKLINLSTDLLWSTDFGKNFSFQYGATVGLAIVFGQLQRVQARPGGTSTASPAPGDPYTYVPCTEADRDVVRNKYCDKDNDHYGDYEDKSWFNGGKKPNLYAIFGPQLGFRFKPVKQFVARLDVGFNIFSGFFFGLGANYGL